VRRIAEEPRGASLHGVSKLSGARGRADGEDLRCRGRSRRARVMVDLRRILEFPESSVSAGDATNIRMARAAFTAGPRGRKAEIRGSHPSCREPSGLLPMRQWSPGTGLTPAAELGAVAARCEHRRPCHPRATSSGHERYPADNLGHSKRSLSGLPAPDLGVRGGPKLHGMQGGRSCRVGLASSTSLPAEPRPMDEAITTPTRVASSGRPPPAARPTGYPDRPGHAVGC
jgi:hypothetical protein